MSDTLKVKKVNVSDGLEIDVTREQYVDMIASHQIGRAYLVYEEKTEQDTVELEDPFDGATVVNESAVRPITLAQALDMEDDAPITDIKGVGEKTAELTNAKYVGELPGLYDQLVEQEGEEFANAVDGYNDLPR